MDVRLPDGRILRGIPEGTTREEIMAKVGGPQVSAPEQVSEPTPQVMRPNWQATPEVPGKMSDFATAERNPDKWMARIPVDLALGALTGGGATVASKIPWIMQNAPRLASMLGFVGKALTTPKGIKELGLGGAIESGVTEAVQPDSTLKSTALSTGLGAVTAPIGQKILGQNTAPRLKTDPRAQRLIDKGVDVTTGGRISPRMRKNEDKIASMPFVGDAMIGARNREKETFNRMLVDDALAPLHYKDAGKGLVPLGPIKKAADEVPYKVPDNIEGGHGSMIYADAQIKKRYGDVLDNMVVVRDPEFVADMARLKGMAQNLPEVEADQYNKIVDAAFDTRISGGSDVLLGQTYKKVFRRLRDKSRQYQKSTDGFQQDLGNSLHEATLALKAMGMRQNPKEAKRLVAVDKAFAKMETIRGAVNTQGAEDGLINANQYLSQVRKQGIKDKSYSHGTAFNQEIAEDARSVMSQKIPNSGTADRLMMAGLLGGGAMSTGAVVPAVLGTAAGTAAYTKPGQKLLNDFLFRNPGPMQEGVRKSMTPFLGLTGAAAATEYERAVRREEEGLLAQ